jgi:flagellar basal body-associated protein FliL
MASTSDFFREAVDGAAKFGRVMSTVYMVIGIITGIVLIGVSIWLFTKPIDHSGHANAKVVSVKSCKRELDKTTTNGKRASTYTTYCDLQIEYTVNGTTYKEDHSTSGSKFYSVGDIIPIRFNPKTPKDFVEGKVSGKRIAAFVILGIGLLVIGGGVFSWYMSRKHKVYAAAQGVGSAFDIID